jgi:hypothetical protein
MKKGNFFRWFMLIGVFFYIGFVGNGIAQNLHHNEDEILKKEENALQKESENPRAVLDSSELFGKIKKNNEKRHASRDWFSSDPEDLKVLMGTAWDFTFTIGDTTFTNTITFGSEVKKDSDGEVYLECYDQQNKSGAVYWTDITELDGLAFKAFVNGNSLTMYYEFKISDDTATGGYWHHNRDDDTVSNNYTLTGVRQNIFFSVAPAYFEAPSVYVGASRIRNFTVRHSGNQDLEIGALSISATTPSFLLQNDNCSGQTIAASGACTFDVIFSPVSSGKKYARVDIPFNDSSGSAIKVPLSESAVDKPIWTSWVLGDVNNSGRVDPGDAILALQSAAEAVLTYPVYTEADIEGDKEINLKEAIYILKVLCGEFVDDDNDGDGYTPGEGDCNDNDAAVHPDAIEICDDGTDQDCKFGDCFTITEGVWYGEADDMYVSFLVRRQGIAIIKLGYLSGRYWVSSQVEPLSPYPVDNNEFYIDVNDDIVTGTFTSSSTCEVIYRGETFLVIFIE